MPIFYPRYRERFSVQRYSHPWESPQITGAGKRVYERISERTPAHSVDHFRIDPYSGVYPHGSAPQPGSDPTLPSSYANYSVYGWVPVEQNPLWSLIPSSLNELNWNKIASSNQFSIIQFIAEIDDNLAIFSRKFWESLNYGSFTWGVVPFVNDMKSILEQISRLDVALSATQPYEDAKKLQLSTQFTDYWGATYRAEGLVTIRHTGVITTDTSLPGMARKYLDLLGLHPDISTFWDLVPLSFVVDWFLPVGDWLATLHDRGWVQSALFDGWISAKTEGSVFLVDHVNYYWKHVPAKLQSFSCNFSHYWRISRSQALSVQRPKAPGSPIKTPDLRQLFNTAYVAKTRL